MNKIIHFLRGELRDLIRLTSRRKQFRAHLERGEWEKLRLLWGNEASAGVELLKIASHSLEPVLECGSGLTTLVLTQRQGFSLEHSLRWYLSVKVRAIAVGVPVNVRLRRLRSYGDFDWYRLRQSERIAFKTVICDGPPASSTRGGRFGLVPAMGHSLLDALIVLDDSQRESEQDVMRRWLVDCGATTVKHVDDGNKRITLLRMRADRASESV